MEKQRLEQLRLKIPFFEGTWSTDKGMSLFLVIMIAVIFVVFPLAAEGMFERLLVDLAFSGMLISGALANRRNRILTWIAILLTVAVLVFHWRSHFAGNYHPRVYATMVIALFGCFVAIMLIEVFRPGAFTFHRVQGAVAAYLSIGIMWGYGYFLAGLLSPGAVQFSAPPAANEIPVARYIYFSFMTLTSVGYGDVIPVRPFARTMAISEALIGQLYPVILIAGILGLALQTWLRAEQAAAPKQ